MFAAQEDSNDCYDEESYDSEDSLDTSLSEDLDTCFVDGHDANMDYACKDELAIVLMLSMKFLILHPNLISLLSFLNLQLIFRRIVLLLRLNVMDCNYLMILKTMLKTIHVCL